MKFAIEKIFKNWKTGLLILILASGFFLRSYHFSDWLHFEIDQTYDIRLVSPAVDNGISNLPLLGPTAGGGRSLRLGPATYYLEYLSALIFGNTPSGHAGLILLFSFISLPLFYLVCRRYFSSYLSLGLLAVCSFSTYLILYSRFSWSPNYLPFFVLLFFWTLLRSVSKKEEKPERWFLWFALVFSLLTQIHFNAFFVIPAVTAAFLIIKRPRFHWKTWALALAIFLFTYSPLIVSDIYNHGENFRFFLEKIGISSGNGSKGGSLDIEKIVRKNLENFRYNSLEYFLIITGEDSINTSRFARDSFGLTCKSCREDIFPRLTGYLSLVLFAIILIWNLFHEKDMDRRDFLLLSGLLGIISFAYYLFISWDGYNIYPRFFLLVSPLAIILLGLFLEKLQPEKDIFRKSAFVLIILALVFSNARKLKETFGWLRNSEKTVMKVETEDIFPEKPRITLAQEEDIMDYMEEKYRENGFPIYLESIHEYAPSFWYFLDRRSIPYDGISQENLYEQGNYFLILPSYKLSSKDTADYKSRFSFQETKNFGTLEVFYLSPDPGAITEEKQNMADKKPTLQSEQVSAILTWKKLFSR